MTPALSPGVIFGFASSPTLCFEIGDKLHGVKCDLFHVSPKAILAQFGFDRHQYARDLFGFGSRTNTVLYDNISELDQSFGPDVVICFTKNRYIEQRFQNRVLFWEMSPLPRINSTYSFFMDPLGHQVNTIPNIHADRIEDLPLSARDEATIDGIWKNKIEASLVAHPLTRPVTEWLSSTSATGRIALLALQPPDWLTYEAAWHQSAVDQMIMQCASEFPPGWTVVPIFHPSQHTLESLNKSIENEFHNVRFPPVELCTGKSEIFLPYIDAVVSISSSLSIQGVLHGKKSITLGASQFSAFTTGAIADIDEIAAPSASTRTRLLAFLSNRYAHPFTLCFHEPGYVAQMVGDLAGNVEAFFDLSNWKARNLEILL